MAVPLKEGCAGSVSVSEVPWSPLCSGSLIDISRSPCPTPRAFWAQG